MCSVDLTSIFEPKRVAVVGASDGTVSVGGKATANVLRSSGIEVDLVNIRGNVQGRTCARTLTELEHVPDVAIVAVRAEAAVEIIKEAATLGVRGIVVFAAGFRELGSVGASRQSEIEGVAREAGIALLGPNCVGISNGVLGIDLTSASETGNGELSRTVGKVAIVSQSGSLGIACAVGHPRKLRYFASTGNEAVVTGPMVIRHLLEKDKSLSAIGLILETIRDPEALAAAAALATDRDVPLVALRLASGRDARRLAELHTGGLGGDRLAVEAFLRAHNVRITTSSRDFRGLLRLADSSTGLPHSSGGRPKIGVFTTSGGTAIMAADGAADRGIKLPDPSASTSVRVAEVLDIDPGRVTNPLDMGGQYAFDPDRFASALREYSADPNFEAVVVPLGGAGGINAESRIRSLLGVLNDTPIPIIPVWQRRVFGESGVDLLEESSTPYFLSHEDAFDALALAATPRGPAASGESTEVAFQSESHDVMGGADAEVSTGVEVPARPPDSPSLVTALGWLRAVGVGAPPWRSVGTHQEVDAACAAVGLPITLKASHPGLAHKSDSGLVLNGLSSQPAAIDGYTRICESAERIDLHGYEVVVQRTLEGEWLEVFCSIFRDREVGLSVVVGLGGVWTELLSDVTAVPVHAAGKLEDRIAFALTDTLRAGAVFSGYRSDVGYDFVAVSQLIATVLSAIERDPLIVAVELNPIAALRPGKGASVLDVKLIHDDGWSRRKPASEAQATQSL